MLRILVSIVVLVVFTPVMAEYVENYDDMTVTARPVNSQSLEHITQPVSILTEYELKRKQTISIGETLANEPGVSASDFGQAASRPIIRGLGGPRLTILQDGLSSMDASSVSVDHAVSVNPFQAEKIEVVRGPATLLYGSGNSAGLVNIVTNTIPQEVIPFSTRFDTRYQSALRAPSASFSMQGSPHNNLSLHFDTFYFKSDDYESANDTVLNSAVETQNHNIGASWVGERGYLGFSYGRYESIYDIPFNPEEPDELIFIDLEQDRFNISGELLDPLYGFSSVNLRIGYNDYTHTEFEGPGEPGTVFFNEEWGTRFEAAHDLIGAWTGVIGMQYQTQDFEAIGDEAFVPPVDFDSVGVFIFEDTDWQDWHFEIGGRYEFQNAKPVASSSLTGVEHHAYSVSLGTHWDFYDGYHIALNTSRSQRAPSIEELFASGPHLATETFEVGSVNLSVETANNLDFSIAKTDGHLTWKVSLFANYIEDYIFQAFQDVDNNGISDEVDENGILGAGNLLSIRLQQNNAIFYGFETEARIGFFENDYGQLSSRIFADVVKAELTNGDNIPRIPSARVGAGLEWSNHNYLANLDLIHVLKQNDVAELETKTDGYVLLNAGLSFAITKHSRLHFKANNLLNEDIRRHTSFIKERAPLPGRSFDIGVSLIF